MLSEIFVMYFAQRFGQTFSKNHKTLYIPFFLLQDSPLLPLHSLKMECLKRHNMRTMFGKTKMYIYQNLGLGSRIFWDFLPKLLLESLLNKHIQFIFRSQPENISHNKMITCRHKSDSKLKNKLQIENERT